MGKGGLRSSQPRSTCSVSTKDSRTRGLEDSVLLKSHRPIITRIKLSSGTEKDHNGKVIRSKATIFFGAHTNGIRDTARIQD